MAEQTIAFQFSTSEQQGEAATLGMWAFLATEVLFFGALIAGYFNYRIWFGAEFIAAARHTKWMLGTANTAILLTSSAFMAMAVACEGPRYGRRTLFWLIGTVLLGAAFIAIKGFEYYLEYQEHLVPALNFDGGHYGNVAQIFFTFYFCATGLHALHLLIGMSLVSWLAIGVVRGKAHRSQTTRLIALYWHFVDLVWVFLFPLIYLAGRNG